MALQALASAVAPASGSAAPLGVLPGYAAGVIKASDIRAAGALGAIRYVSDRRPGGSWMLGKPIQLAEARDLYQNGTIEWALQDGLGTYYWQHNWGSPGKVTHPAAHLHQVEIDERSVGGVGGDINHLLKPRYGQWD